MANKSEGSAAEIVFLFTSAPPNRSQYTLDFLTCLASPDGHRVTFSYKRKWLSDDVYADELVGKRALVVFSELDEDAGDLTFFPLRWAEIKSFEPQEIIEKNLAQPDTRLAITFKLDRFLYADPNMADEIVAAATTALRAFTVRPYPRDQGGADSRWVILGAYKEECGKVDTQTAWLAHADQLSKCTSLEKALIFRVSKPEYLGWRRQTATAPVRRNRLIGDAYKLRASKQYKLVVRFFHSGTSDADPKDLVRADVSSAKVMKTAPISTALGQETVATIFFGAERLAAAELATVTIQGPPNLPDYLAPIVAFIVRFRPVWPSIIVGAAAIAAGVLLNGLTADDWKELSVHLSSGYLLALKFIGAVIAAIGALYAFRHGPSGG